MIKNFKAFSLVEIMIVVAIIALLSAIAIPNAIRARVNSNNTVAQATLKSISTALENYYAINTAYPIDINDLIGDSPPYLSVDYFNGAHNGFTYTPATTNSTYSVTAIPQGANFGAFSYTITTGAVLTKN